ncbi:MAG: S46 family peptidase [Hyphomonadaceae bacterium]
MRLTAVVAACAFLSAAAHADEGMWTFDNFPSAKVKEAYGFAPDKAWLDRVQRASVRLENGCSGSVISKSGLVLTNHHCVADCAQSLSSARADLLADGFLAASRKEEKGCPGLEVSILQSITDVTERVQGATAGVAPAQVSSMRSAEMGRIEQEACGDDRKLHCEVVTLYRGGQYKLYRYDRYDDVRLAFAPELQAAFFGGDPDNFNFPRYAVDMALLRIYRDGKPAAFKAPLKLDPKGASDGDPVFVSGHPGSTNRLLTVSQLEFQRDHYLPWRVEYLAQIRGALLATAAIGEEEERQVREALFGVENSVKVFKGQRGALVEPAFFAGLESGEQKLRDALAADAGLREKYGDPFKDIEALAPVRSELWMPYQMLELRMGAGSQLLADARTLVRGATERAKPASDRLPEYADGRLAGHLKALSAETPIHPVLERLELEFWLLKTREYLGPDNSAVKALFGGRSASDIARDIAENSSLSDPAVRKRLWEHPEQVLTSNDPAIVLFRLFDEAARATRKSYEERVAGPESQASERIAAVRFAVLGSGVYPDATFTLRLSYGQVKGWDDPAFGKIPAFTYVSGLWKRATGAFPFNLAPHWQGAETKIDGAIPMNFVSTNDIIGGNSGSPVLNRKGDVIGLAFDGNIHSLGGAFGYDPVLNRTVSVASPFIVAALDKIYGAKALVKEIED